MSATEEFEVAIIGAGIGGASAAYYLRSLFHDKVQITIYEKSGEIGGRIKSVDFAGQHCEAGAIVVHSSNNYMMNFAKQYDLPLKNVSKADQRTVVLDNTSQEVFSSLEGCEVMAFGKTAWRYGLDLMRIRSYVKSVVKDFGRIYRLQDEGHCFTTPAHLLAAMRPEFVEMTKHTYDEWLKTKLRLSPKVCDELAYGLMYFHYCQGMDAHAFVGLISLAAAIPSIYLVGTGNQQIPQKVIQQSLAGNSNKEIRTIIHATVKKIEHVDQSHKYKLTFEDSKTGQTIIKEYDYVILACPLNQESGLEYLGNKTLPSTTFVEMDRVLYNGKLKPNDTSLVPLWCEKKQWITVLQAKTVIPNSNIPYGMMHLPAQHPYSTGHKMIWLAHSNPKTINNPGTRVQDLYFEKHANSPIKDGSDYKVIRWYAYPVYKKVDDPDRELGSFVIAPGLFYLNALENAASCMEVSAIAGRNAALLVAHSRNAKPEVNGSQSCTTRILVDHFNLPKAETKRVPDTGNKH